MATTRPEPTVRARRGPTPGTPRAPRMSRADREAQLLEIATEVFSGQGYAVTTMEEIAERAGITKPVIYDHFGSKEGLLAACIAEGRQQLLDQLEQAWTALPPGSTVEASFRAGVRAFMVYFEDRRSSFAMVQAEGAVSATHATLLEEIRLAPARLIAAQFATNPALRDVPVHLLEGMAEVVVGTNERVAFWRLRHPEVTLDEAVDMVMAVLWRGFANLIPRR